VYQSSGDAAVTLEVEGKTIETDANGYLVNQEDWNEQVAEAIAAKEGLTLTERHWDVLHYLRDEYFNNAGHQPNTRIMLKDLGERWGKAVESKELYDLFPGNPTKQAYRVAGLPETRRKGGY
jgi:tRNA 2-thiouridine synthesizing protein E